jgi:hypothetical protein
MGKNQDPRIRDKHPGSATLLLKLRNSAGAIRQNYRQPIKNGFRSVAQYPRIRHIRVILLYIPVQKIVMQNFKKYEADLKVPKVYPAMLLSGCSARDWE